jgi:hypothetical protein
MMSIVTKIIEKKDVGALMTATASMKTEKVETGSLVPVLRSNGVIMPPKSTINTYTFTVHAYEDVILNVPIDNSVALRTVYYAIADGQFMFDFMISGISQEYFGIHCRNEIGIDRAVTLYYG